MLVFNDNRTEIMCKGHGQTGAWRCMIDRKQTLNTKPGNAVVLWNENGSWNSDAEWYRVEARYIGG